MNTITNGNTKLLLRFILYVESNQFIEHFVHTYYYRYQYRFIKMYIFTYSQHILQLNALHFFLIIKF